MGSQRSWEAIPSSLSFVVPQDPPACGIYKASCWHCWGDGELAHFTDICIWLGYWANTWIFISLDEKRTPGLRLLLSPYLQHLRIAKLSTMFTFIITCSYQVKSYLLPPDLPACQNVLHLLLGKLVFGGKLFRERYRLLGYDFVSSEWWFQKW